MLTVKGIKELLNQISVVFGTEIRYVIIHWEPNTHLGYNQWIMCPYCKTKQKNILALDGTTIRVGNWRHQLCSCPKCNGVLVIG